MVKRASTDSRQVPLETLATGLGEKSGKPKSRQKKEKIKRGKSTRLLFPRVTLEEAIKIPFSIKDHNSGRPWSTEQVAKAVGMGPKTPKFFYLAAASRDYGLTEGTRDTQEIGLTELGRQLVYPENQEALSSSRIASFEHVEIFKNVLEYYNKTGGSLPEIQFLNNTLQKVFGLQLSECKIFTDVYNSNLSFIGGPTAVATSKPTVKGDTVGSTIVISQTGRGNAQPMTFVVPGLGMLGDLRRFWEGAGIHGHAWTHRILIRSDHGDVTSIIWCG